MKRFSTNGLLNRDRAETVYAEIVLQDICCLLQVLTLEHEKKRLQTGDILSRLIARKPVICSLGSPRQKLSEKLGRCLGETK